MFRRPSGILGFSFSRLITNAVPNFANDNADRDANLSLAEQDMLWAHQISSASIPGRHPMDLDAGSFLSGGVTTSSRISQRIYETLLRGGLIFPIGSTGAANKNGINTSLITPKFAHRFAFISVAAQRKLVGLLFFWEEEVVRYRFLDEEEAEIKKVIADIQSRGADVEPDLTIALKRVQMKKSMTPSQRLAAEAENAQEPEVDPAGSIGGGDGPPEYYGRTET